MKHAQKVARGSRLISRAEGAAALGQGPENLGRPQETNTQSWAETRRLPGSNGPAPWGKTPLITIWKAAKKPTPLRRHSFRPRGRRKCLRQPEAKMARKVRPPQNNPRPNPTPPRPDPTQKRGGLTQKEQRKPTRLPGFFLQRKTRTGEGLSRPVTFIAPTAAYASPAGSVDSRSSARRGPLQDQTLLAATPAETPPLQLPKTGEVTLT